MENKPCHFYLYFLLLFPLQTLASTQAQGVYDKTYIEKKIRDTQPGGKVHLNSGIYEIDQLVIDKPITIEGDGSGTLLKMVGANTYAINVIRGSNRNEEGQNHDVVLKDFKLDGNNRRDHSGGITISNLDHATIEGITIENFRGSAINIEKSFRESVLNNIHIRYCGTAESPAINIGQKGGGDATNNIFLSNIFVVYSFGTDIFVGNTTDNGESVRRIFADHIFLHGALPAVIGKKYNWSEAEIQSVRLKIGDVFDFRIRDSTVNVAGIDKPAIVVGTELSQRIAAQKKGFDSPANVVISDITIGARFQLMSHQVETLKSGQALTVLSGENILLENIFCLWQGSKDPVSISTDVKGSVKYTIVKY